MMPSDPNATIIQALKVAATEYRLYAEVHPSSPASQDLIDRAEAMDILRLELEQTTLKLIRSPEKPDAPKKPAPKLKRGNGG